jgi:hypothetical protein
LFSVSGRANGGEVEERNGQGTVLYLQISVDDPVVVAVVDALEDLLDAVGGVGLAVKFPRDDVLEEFATGDPASGEQYVSNTWALPIAPRGDSSET